MKLKILKTELIIQILVISICFIWFVLEHLKTDSYFIMLYVLIFLAISNTVGFLIRIFTYKSKLMAYYFFGVIFYLLTLGQAVVIDQAFEAAFFRVYLFGGGLLLSFYYNVSGFFIIREISSNS